MKKTITCPECGTITMKEYKRIAKHYNNPNISLLPYRIQLQNEYVFEIIDTAYTLKWAQYKADQWRELLGTRNTSIYILDQNNNRVVSLDCCPISISDSIPF